MGCGAELTQYSCWHVDCPREIPLSLDGIAVFQVRMQNILFFVNDTQNFVTNLITAVVHEVSFFRKIRMPMPMRACVRATVTSWLNGGQ